MYLSANQCEQLDAVCNRFETALRTHVASAITSSYDEQSFSEVLR